jgi:hypothetical protein
MTIILGALPTTEPIAEPGSARCEIPPPRPGRAGCFRTATARLSFAAGDGSLLRWLLCERHASEVETVSATPTTRRPL